MRARLLKRITEAVSELNLGIPVSLFKTQPLRAINRALTLTGAPRIPSLQSEAALRRAASALEGAVS
tara:strand:+ start:17011 stop:17211 length:201 start_codon:yes stop_codon:yes gene_type:complete